MKGFEVLFGFPPDPNILGDSPILGFGGRESQVNVGSSATVKKKRKRNKRRRQAIKRQRQKK